MPSVGRLVRSPSHADAADGAPQPLARGSPHQAQLPDAVHPPAPRPQPRGSREARSAARPRARAVAPRQGCASLQATLPCSTDARSTGHPLASALSVRSARVSSGPHRRSGHHGHLSDESTGDGQCSLRRITGVRPDPRCQPYRRAPVLRFRRPARFCRGCPVLTRRARSDRAARLARAKRPLDDRPRLSDAVTSFQHSGVVTEQGCAHIFGRSQRAQARLIIEHAAHPDACEELRQSAATLDLDAVRTAVQQL